MKFHVQQVSTWNTIAYQSCREELALKGFTLSSEDMEVLLQTVRMACRKFKIMETKSDVLFQCIRLFQNSPYAKQDNFLQLLKDALYVYYFIRGNVLNRYYDDEVMNTVYTTYLLNFGKLDKTMRKKCLHILLKEECDESATSI